MKPLNKFALSLVIGVSAVALVACEEPKVDAAVFDNLQQCINDKTITGEQCEQSYKEAVSKHAEVAPKYTSAADCQADFGAGQCEQAPYRTTSGGSIFMPLMAGYMMGSFLGGRRGSVIPQPLYRSAGDKNTYRTSDNRKVGSTTGRTQVARSATSRPSFKSSTMSRGGFGRSGSRFGSAAT
jgi:uncharacterized protein YgiB involved in biofilm formation